MPLVATMVCLDDSEWMRNGDYTPDRLTAQKDAVNMIIRRRLQMNPENTVGLLFMAGRGTTLKVTPSRDNQKLLAATQDVQPRGKIKLVNSVKIATLALKHRQNRAGSQRIVVFVGSPVTEPEKNIKKLGKTIKKAGIALDLILLGCDKANEEFAQNEALCKVLVDAANKDNNSHLTVIAPGVLPSSVISNSHLCVDGAGAPGLASEAAASGGAAGADFGGADPSMDPQLAMVMRMSLMEERERQEAALKEAMDKSTGGAAAAGAADAGAAAAVGDTDMTDAQLLQQALALSRTDAEAAPATPSQMAVVAEDEDDEDEDEDEDYDEDDDDAALQAALLMSQQLQAPSPSPTPVSTPAVRPAPVVPAAPAAVARLPRPTPEPVPAPAAGVDLASMLSFNDPAFVQNMLRDLPGVNVDDPRIQAAMMQIANSGDSAAKTEEKKKEDS